MQVILRPIHARNRMVSHDELVIIYNENIFKRCLFLPNSGNSFQESMFAFEGEWFEKIIILKLKVFFLIKIESRGTEACSRLVFFPLLPVGSFQRVPAIFNISEFLFS